MKKTLFALTAATLVSSLAGMAIAQQPCMRNGETYPDGTRIGDLKCENGQWVVVQ